MPTRSLLNHSLVLIALGASLAGCGSFTNSDVGWGPRIGFRPDDPSFKTTRNVSVGGEEKRVGLPDATRTWCDELDTYIVYGLNLKEAYRTRATQNRSWIYASVLIALGVATAGGALAAASAASAGTLAIMGLSGAFAAGAFASIDNAQLANVYTVAANEIGTALACAEYRLTNVKERGCNAELGYLTLAVANARNTLETARTTSAAGALARATAEKKLLDQEITKIQAAKDAADKKEAVDKASTELATARKAEEGKKNEADKTPADATKARELGEATATVKQKEKALDEKKVEAAIAAMRLKVEGCEMDPPTPK
jgi:hypothetical protein